MVSNLSHLWLIITFMGETGVVGVTVVCVVTVVSVVGVRSWCWSFRLSSALFILALFYLRV